jgi:hypothetical protein
LGACSLIGVGLRAAVVDSVAFFGDASQGDACFALFLTFFLVVLAMGAFFRFPLAFPLAFRFITTTASRDLTAFRKSDR